ncbi:putative protein kinase RLK-Pelle-LysM family [Helianthus debilis subsp. tardiflorus]
MLEPNLVFRLVAFIGCDLALGSYYTGPSSDVFSIAEYINTDASKILKYNQDTVPNVQSFVRIKVPFSCDCIDGEFLGHVFNYDLTSGDTYETIAQQSYSNLTTADWIQRFNTYDPDRLPDTEETLDSISSAANLSSELIRSYNPDATFSQGSGLIYIPWRDENGNYPPFKTSSGEPGLSGGTIGGITIGIVAVLLFLAGCLYIGVCRKKSAQAQLMHVQGINIDISVEFSYEELSAATQDFSLANKIGQGGFGAVYYAELRGEKVAIKKMDMQASRQFQTELKVLTHVNHLNLVRLIGYCVEGCLCLVYEYIENGNLSQHLHGSGRDPLPWSTRIQVALDSARGLQYIHEHTVDVYVHCDIKSENILIDENFHGKIADFGITRLDVVGSRSRLVGTFGYMPPEYIQYGDVSPKVDVFALGVLLYELISAKPAIIRANNDDDPKGLVALFDEIFRQADPKEGLVKMIDPRLGDNYPLDSVYNMAQLAKVCTREDHQRRPSMRSIVVALMKLSLSTED